MHAFDVLGDPVRRRILELLGAGDQLAGDIAARIHEEFGISPSAVSQHLKVLRDNGFAVVHPEGTRRRYALQGAPLRAADAWLAQFESFWEQRLDALSTEIARGRSAARRPGRPAAGEHHEHDPDPDQHHDQDQHEHQHQHQERTTRHG